MSAADTPDSYALKMALDDLYKKQLHAVEKRLAREEEEYLRVSMGARSDSVPQFGNLVSGWEGILEGTRVDMNKGKEKIYSRASRRGRRAGAPSFLPLLLPALPCLLPLLPAHFFLAAAAESSATWREFQDARALEKETRSQEAQAQATRNAIKDAMAKGASHTEAEEAGKAAAAAAAVAFKTNNKIKPKRLGVGVPPARMRGDDD